MGHPLEIVPLPTYPAFLLNGQFYIELLLPPLPLSFSPLKDEVADDDKDDGGGDGDAE